MTDLSAAKSTMSVPAWLRVMVLVVAALELLGGLRDFPILLGDTSQIPGPGVGGFIIKAKIALQPVVAALAVIFAIAGRLRYALIALGVVILLTWANYMPSVFLHGLDAGDGLGGVWTLFQIVLAPLIAATIIALAIRDQHLTLAAALAVLPTLVGVLGVLAFAIGVGIYGF